MAKILLADFVSIQTQGTALVLKKRGGHSVTEMVFQPEPETMENFKDNIKQFKPDLIILEPVYFMELYQHRLPHYPSFLTLLSLLQTLLHKQQVKIIFLTCCSEHEFKKVGVEEFPVIVKPADPEEVLQKVKDLLG